MIVTGQSDYGVPRGGVCGTGSSCHRAGLGGLDQQNSTTGSVDCMLLFFWRVCLFYIWWCLGVRVDFTPREHLESMCFMPGMKDYYKAGNKDGAWS